MTLETTNKTACSAKKSVELQLSPQIKVDKQQSDYSMFPRKKFNFITRKNNKVRPGTRTPDHRKQRQVYYLQIKWQENWKLLKFDNKARLHCKSCLWEKKGLLPDKRHLLSKV